MKIELKSGNIKFERLSEGKTFAYEGLLCQKFRQINDSNGQYNAISCCDGVLYRIFDYDTVRLVKGTFRED